MKQIINIRQIIAYNVRKFRELKKLTQQQLAEKSEITPLALCKIEGAKVWPKDSSLENIANALEIDITMLFLNTIVEDKIQEDLRVMQNTLSDFKNMISTLQEQSTTKSSYSEKLIHYKR